ncbi:helix-turn-helix transcriptional regulator [Oscillibacter sp.]|uniref:helix-turn-helix domain-containing protein n=1 Tax=Oscillibacter sp. TaxID=1945593 RepID=UPI00289D2288|nr:helix-turn-helix transcriptional regulator [Oscillibacter sp.]
MLGEYLKQYRTINGMTQADLAVKLSVSQNAISQYETGKRCPPISRIANISKILGCSVSQIVSDSGT